MNYIKQYTSKENPFKWQIQEQYRKLVEALSQVSEERMEEITAFIKVQLKENEVYLSEMQAHLRNMILHHMKDHIREITSRENYQKERDTELYRRSEQKIVEEQDTEDYLESFDGADRAFMEYYLHGGFGGESESNECSEDEEDKREFTEEEYLEVVTAEDDANYEDWVKIKLDEIGDQDDPQNLLKQLFDSNEGYSWFVHELLVYTLDLESGLVDKIEFMAGEVTQRELSVLFTAINFYIDWEVYEVGDDNYILTSLTCALDRLCEDRVGDYDFALERFRDRVLLYDEEGLPEEFHALEEKYNEAYVRNDLIAMQRIWSIYSAYRKILNDKQVLDDEGVHLLHHTQTLYLQLIA